MAAQNSSRTTLKVAVITGNHPFDLPAFHQLFRRLPNVDAYPQPLADFVADRGGVRNMYDVLVFYNFHQSMPGESEGAPDWLRGTRNVLTSLGETDQGIVVLHHGLLAFRDWRFWSELVGIENRQSDFYPEQTLRVEIADSDHPIVAELSPWTMVDETYTMDEPDPACRVLLRTDHPRSLRALAWTHLFRGARVFCYEAGHDARAYENANFQIVLGRGIRWAAGLLG